MNLQNNETVFVTGRGMKNKSVLVCGWILIAGGIILSIAFSSGSAAVFFWGAVVYGIIDLSWYFRYQKMTIAVSDLRIMGKAIAQSSVNIPLGQVTAVMIQRNGFLKVTYHCSGAQRSVRFPKMENTEQIYNAIYSLTSAPPSPRA